MGHVKITRISPDPAVVYDSRSIANTDGDDARYLIEWSGFTDRSEIDAKAAVKSIILREIPRTTGTAETKRRLADGLRENSIG